jgi:hypothetical protein
MSWSVIGKPRKDAQPESADADRLSIQIQWVDEPEAEFTAESPFNYNGRVNPTDSVDRDAFKAAANAKRDAERTKRANADSKKQAFENFLNN